MIVTTSRPGRTPAGAVLSVALGAVLIAGCSAAVSPTASSSAGGPAFVVTPSPSPTPSSADTSGASGSSEPTGVVTDLDPCQLVTSDEASTLSGVSFSAGQESTTEGNGKICTYGQEGNVFSVIVGVAPDVATAQAGEQAAEADLQKAANNGLKLTELKGFNGGTADAAVLEGSQSVGGLTLSASAIYLLKGTTFFGFSDFATGGGKAPSSEALQAQAITSMGRLP
jgi:Protein of unknown function (DUF3558)